jgi:hypothetical protein
MYDAPITHLSLEEYWETLQIQEPAGYGIKNAPNAITGWGCGDYWNQTQRYYTAWAIAKTEKRLKNQRWFGFPVRREYIAEEVEYTYPAVLKTKMARCVGVHMQTSLGDKTISLGTLDDPVTFTHTVSFTDVNELLIAYPSQDPVKYFIRPSYAKIVGTTLTVEIPRSRLLKPAYFIDYSEDASRPDYTDDTYFLTTVELFRDYCRPPGINLVWHRHQQGCTCVTSYFGVCQPDTACGEEQQYACGYITDQPTSAIVLEPVTLNDDLTFDPACFDVNRTPDLSQIWYMAGYEDRYEELPEDMVRAIIALAHNNMVEEWCSCSMQQRYFKRDTNPIEPAVRLGLGPSTWGVQEAAEIVGEYRVFEGGFL